MDPDTEGPVGTEDKHRWDMETWVYGDMETRVVGTYLNKLKSEAAEEAARILGEARRSPPAGGTAAAAPPRGQLRPRRSC